MSILFTDSKIDTATKVQKQKTVLFVEVIDFILNLRTVFFFFFFFFFFNLEKIES